MPERPGLSERSLGWLRYLHDKAHTEDDWSRHGAPHPHWDDRSDPPTRSRHRFDLVESSYAMGLMAHRTPAWTEPYVAVLDRLIERHTGWWSAADWFTQFGNDPDRSSYPDAYRSLVPDELWGSYDAPGWTANGVEPWGVQMDPIAADGMLSYKGFFLVVLGVRAMISIDDRWNDPFDMIGDGDNTFTWTHSSIAESLTDQWQAAPVGCHCENTKVWPSRLAGAGLGLWMHDKRFGTDFHQRAVRPWWAHAGRDFLGLTGSEPPAITTLYHDPVLDVRHRVPVGAVLPASAYVAPQFPDDAAILFDAAWRSMGLDSEPLTPLPSNRGIPWALLLAREWGLDDVADRLAAAVDASWGPTWDHDTGHFTWDLGLDERHPRGQLNALLAAAEAVGPGGFSRLTSTPLEPCPQIVDVDLTELAFTRAEWIDGNLHLRLSPRCEDRGRSTYFRIVGAEPRNWEVHGLDGLRLELTTSGLNVSAPLVAGDVTLIRSSY